MNNIIKSLCSIPLIGLLLFSSIVQTFAIDDITGTTFETYIRNLKVARIVSGYSDGNFYPDNSVTRGQMAKFIYNAFLSEESVSLNQAFSDVDSSNIFYEYINTIKEMGIVDGYSDGTYRPNDPVTRGAATKFVFNAMKKGGQEIEMLSQNIFFDVSTANTFEKYISFLGSFAVISGYSDGSYRSELPLSRGAMAKIIDNARSHEIVAGTQFSRVINTRAGEAYDISLTLPDSLEYMVHEHDGTFFRTIELYSPEMFKSQVDTGIDFDLSLQLLRGEEILEYCEDTGLRIENDSFGTLSKITTTVAGGDITYYSNHADCSQSETLMGAEFEGMPVLLIQCNQWSQDNTCDEIVSGLEFKLVGAPAVY